jgi:hypothetical protein
MDLVDALGIEAQGAQREGTSTLRGVADRLAGIDRFEDGEFLGRRFQPVGQREHGLLALRPASCRATARFRTGRGRRATARSMSAALPAGSVLSMRPVPGSRLSRLSPLAGARSAPITLSEEGVESGRAGWGSSSWGAVRSENV